MTRSIYPDGDFGQEMAMDAAFEPSSAPHPADRAGRIGAAMILIELALSASAFGTPAIAQSVQRVELVGTVAARCSGGAPIPAGLGNLPITNDGIRRAVTVRCSGTSPALSIRVGPSSSNAVLTATGVSGQTGSATAAAGEGITSSSLGDRLATIEGNLTVAIPDAGEDGGTQSGHVEIVVSPEV